MTALVLGHFEITDDIIDEPLNGFRTIDIIASFEVYNHVFSELSWQFTTERAFNDI